MGANEIANAVVAGGVVSLGDTPPSRVLFAGSWGLASIEQHSTGVYSIELEAPQFADVPNGVSTAVPVASLFGVALVRLFVSIGTAQTVAPGRVFVQAFDLTTGAPTTTNFVMSLLVLRGPVS